MSGTKEIEGREVCEILEEIKQKVGCEGNGVGGANSRE